MKLSGGGNRVKRYLGIGAVALFAGQCIAFDALADCGSVVNATTECNGDNSSISFTDGSVTTITIDDLTSDIGGDTAVQLEQTVEDGSGQDSGGSGNAGTAASELTVDGTFDDGYGIAADSIRIKMVSTGGVGATGADSDKQANDGGLGGEGGKLVVTLSGGETLSEGEIGLLLETVGGVGGDVTVTFSDGFTLDINGDGPKRESS